MLQMPLNLAFERLLRRLGGGQDGADLQKVEHTEAVHRRAHHNLRTVELELRLDDRTLHDLQGPEHCRKAAGGAGRMRARSPVTSTATNRLARPMRWSNGSGLTAP